MTSSIQDDTMNESSPLLAADTYSTSYLTKPLLGSVHDFAVVTSNPLLAISEDLPSLSDDGDDSQPSFSGLLFFKSLYFLNGLSASTWGRFGVIYYNRVKHLSPEQIGVLQGAMPLLGMVTMPFWGYVADLVRSRKRVYLFCKALGTIALLSLSLSSIDTFPSILLCVSGMAIFRASGVLDAHTLDFLGRRHRTMYGTIRMWAAISWGIGAVLMGWITDSFGFRWNFGLYGGMMILMLVIMAYGLPARSKSEQVRYDRSALGHAQRCPRTIVLVKALCRPTVLFWLLEVEAIGAGMCLVDSFLFVFLQNELNASTTLCGYAVGITVIFELPIFHYSQYLLKTMGHDKLFMSAMLAYIVRVFGYTLLTPSSVHWVLLLEILHGITFACMWIASIDFSAAAAPRDWATTFQSILSMTMSCIGGGIGPMLGGYVMGRYGPVFMYRGAGWFITAVLVVHAVVCLDCRRGYDAFLESLDTKRVEARDVLDSSTIEEAAVDNTRRDME